MTTDEKRRHVESFGYKVATWDAFLSATDVPDGIKHRAQCLLGQWVIYDPLDDGNGWFVHHDDLDRVLTETVEHIS